MHGNCCILIGDGKKLCMLVRKDSHALAPRLTGDADQRAASLFGQVSLSKLLSSEGCMLKLCLGSTHHASECLQSGIELISFLRLQLLCSWCCNEPVPG